MKVIITGSTGMVGQAVLIECLEHNKVEEVLVVNRSSIGLNNPKLKEIIHKDFADFSAIKDQLAGYDACFHCMGVSAAGMSDEKYMALTFGISKSLADVLFETSPGLVFNYVSGTGTDSSENGNTTWANVKGKTENYIFEKGFKDAYAFRPGVILPEKGVQSKTSLYNIMYILTRPLFPLLRKLDSITTSSKVGLAMINSVLKGQDNKILENVDINNLAKK